MFMVEIDMQGNFVSWTAVTLAYLGYTETEVRAMTVFDIVSEGQLEVVLEGLGKQPAIPEGTAYDVTIKKKNGQWIDVRVTPKPVLGKDGELRSVKCFFTAK